MYIYISIWTTVKAQHHSTLMNQSKLFEQFNKLIDRSTVDIVNVTVDNMVGNTINS